LHQIAPQGVKLCYMENRSYATESVMSPSARLIRTMDGRQRVMTAETAIPCFRCGFCCTLYRPPLHPEDIERIASPLGMSTAEFISRYAERVPTSEGYLLRATERGCIFLTWKEDGKACCAIYPFRPRACREWTPSLSKPECLEGLATRKSKGQLILLDELFSSEDDKAELSSALAEPFGHHWSL
jgi:Fe-S-cluster containining protein